MKKDLDKLQSLDVHKKPSDDSHAASATNQLPDLMSADMHREILREKWEKEQQEMLKNQDTVHYANVQFDGMGAMYICSHM